MLDRRTFLAAASAAAAVLARPALLRAAEPLILWGPPAAPSIVLAHAVASGLLRDAAPQAAFKAWRTPDEMRAGISSGAMKAVIVPSYVAANLHNRGLGLSLANIMTRGLLHIVAAPETDGLKGLAGKKLAVPFRNDMPDFILRRLLDGAGLTAGDDIELHYAATPPEAVQLLLSGRTDAALLAEPAVSAAIVRAGRDGRKLVRAVDCQKAWAARVGGEAAIPQAGLAVTDALVGEIGADGLKALQAGLTASVEAVNGDPAAAAKASAEAIGLPPPVIEQAIAHSNLVALPASSLRQELAAFFALLAEDDPRIIGGKQPGKEFYAL